MTHAGRSLPSISMVAPLVSDMIVTSPGTSTVGPRGGGSGPGPRSLRRVSATGLVGLPNSNVVEFAARAPHGSAQDLVADKRDVLHRGVQLRELRAVEVEVAVVEAGHHFVTHDPCKRVETEARLAEHGVKLLHLCTWWDVLAEARAQGAFDEKTLTEVEAFLNDPRAWQAARAK